MPVRVGGIGGLRASAWGRKFCFSVSETAEGQVQLRRNSACAHISRHKMTNMALHKVIHKPRTKLSNQQCCQCQKSSSLASRSPPSNQASPCAPQAASRRRAPPACRTPTAHGRPSPMAHGGAELPASVVSVTSPASCLLNCARAYAHET